MYKDGALERISDLNRTVIIEAVVAMLELGRAHADSYRQMAEATDARMDDLESQISGFVSMVENDAAGQMKTSVRTILSEAVSDWKAALDNANKNTD